LRFIICLCFVALIFTFSQPLRAESSKSDQQQIKNEYEKTIPWKSAQEQSLSFKKTYKIKKAAGVSFVILGALTIVTGFGFMGAFGEEGAFIGAPFMFGGLTLISTGLTINSSAYYSLKGSEAFDKISGSRYDHNMSAMQYYETSGIKLSVKKEASDDFGTKGIILTSISTTLLVASIGCFIGAAVTGSNNKSDNSDESDNNDGDIGEAMGEGLESALLLMVGVSGLVSGVIIFSEGISLLAVSSKWSRLNPQSGSVTLNSIAPIIDPVSKTYGLSMGFSF